MRKLIQAQAANFNKPIGGVRRKAGTVPRIINTLRKLLYAVMVLAMIRSFRNREAEVIWARRFIKSIPNDMARTAYRKLVQLHNARSLDDLKAPPGNRLEALQGDRQGQHSIRINRQWRVCFRWSEGDAHDVEITDYH